ncbi:MAG: NADAR family protein [Chloroflexi bacterium]|nr:NADAR family protein [Chloroflexota bacterium]
MTIYFYSAREKPYGCFSNFSPHGIEIDGLYYRTSEHYFQSMKFLGSPDDMEAVRQARTPKQAASIGRDRSRPLRPDWEEVKDDVMRRAVLAKFETHADIREILLATGDALIVENAPKDRYWGSGADGTGKNMLGIILMETRTILSEQDELT